MSEKKIDKIPSLFEFLSYMNNFTTGYIGLWVDYKEHDNWIQLKGDYENIPLTFGSYLK